MSTDLHPQYCPSQALVKNFWVVPQQCPGLPRSPPVSPGLPQWPPGDPQWPPGDPWWLLFKNDANEKKGTKWPKAWANPLFFFQKTETVSWGLAINEWRPKNYVVYGSRRERRNMRKVFKLPIIKFYAGNVPLFFW